MNTTKLQSGYYMFGNKGAVWANKAHIAHKDSETLCGTPMLSTNWAHIKNLQEVNCPECLAIYGKPSSEDWKTMINAMKYQANRSNPVPVVIPERFAEYMIDHFTNCLPPITSGRDFVLCSDPYDFDSETATDTYIGFYTKQHICYGVITTFVKFKKFKNEISSN